MARMVLEERIRIARPPRDVWDVLGDFGNVALWAPSISWSRQTTGPDIGVGSRRELRFRRFLRMEQAVTEWRPDQEVAYSVFGAPFPLRHFQESWRVVPAADGSTVITRVEYDIRVGLTGRMVERLLVRRLLRREMRLGQRGLKRVVEATQGASEAGASRSDASD